MLLNFVIVFAIWWVQANHEGFNFNGTHQLPISADNISTVGATIHAEKKNTKVLLVAIRKTDLDVNAENSEYTFMARKQMEENIRT
jgi:hypothetical protein